MSRVRSFAGIAGGAAVGIAGAILAAAPAVAQVAYSGSVQYATGDYIFTERTSSFYLFSGLSASFGRAIVDVSVPLIVQNTPWVSYSGGRMIASGGAEHDSVGGHMGGRHGGGISLPDTAPFDQMGLGDPVASAGVELWRERGALPSVRVLGLVKAPLADVDRGFGTGEWDYGGGLSLAKTAGSLFLFADATYWALGDLPGLELKDGLSYGVAVGIPFGGARWSLLGSFSGSTTVVEGTDPPAQIGVGVSRYLDSGRSLSGSAAMGLSESSPDLSLSIGWRIPLGRR